MGVGDALVFGVDDIYFGIADEDLDIVFLVFPKCFCLFDAFFVDEGDYFVTDVANHDRIDDGENQHESQEDTRDYHISHKKSLSRLVWLGVAFWDDAHFSRAFENYRLYGLHIRESVYPHLRLDVVGRDTRFC